MSSLIKLICKMIDFLKSGLDQHFQDMAERYFDVRRPKERYWRIYCWDRGGLVAKSNQCSLEPLYQNYAKWIDDDISHIDRNIDLLAGKLTGS